MIVLGRRARPNQTIHTIRATVIQVYNKACLNIEALTVRTPREGLNPNYCHKAADKGLI